MRLIKTAATLALYGQYSYSYSCSSYLLLVTSYLLLLIKLTLTFLTFSTLPATSYQAQLCVKTQNCFLVTCMTKSESMHKSMTTYKFCHIVTLSIGVVLQF